jgi:hypothetical protein
LAIARVCRYRGAGPGPPHKFDSMIMYEQTPEGYISKDIYILSYIQKSPKRIFLTFFGAGYVEDIIS